MNRTEINHPRVFDEREWAESYYRRQKFSIAQMGKRLAGILKKDGFSGGRILDVGCGFAAIPLQIAKAIPGAEIVGIDLGDPLLEIGNNIIRQEKLEGRITLVKGDAQQTGFDDQSFDVVINTFLLHIVEDPLAMLNEIERVAKPGARILISDLRRFFMGYFIAKFRCTYTLNEAMEIISHSKLRQGKGRNGPFWWDYFVLRNERR